MKKIECPSCKKYIKQDLELCPYCGFTIKRVHTLKAEMYKAAELEFAQAIINNDIVSAYKAVGRIEAYGDKEEPIYTALVAIIDQKYEYAESLLKDKTGKSLSDKYNKILLRIYSEQGKIYDFYKLLLECSERIAFAPWEEVYLLQNVFLNSSDDEYWKFAEIAEQVSIEPHKVSENSTNSDYLKERVLVNFATSLTDAAIDKVEFIINIFLHNDYSIPELKNLDISRKQIIVSFWDVYMNDDEFPDNYLYELVHNIDPDKTDVVQYSREVAQCVLHILLGDNRNENPELLQVALVCLYNLGCLDLLKQVFDEHKDILMKAINYPSFSQLRYIVSLFYKNEFHKAENLSNHLHLEDNLDELSRNYRLLKKLTIEGALALQAAEWIFKSSNSSEFGFTDAGPISLSFFRIIEIEFNERLIKPISNNIDRRELSNLFKKDLTALSKQEADKYKNRWNSKIKYFTKEKSDADNFGMMLGSIYYLLQDSKSDKDKEVGGYFYNKILLLLTSEGKKAYFEGSMAKIINPYIVRKYRNPPAHTKYLSFETAFECKNYVYDAIEKMYTWFESVDDIVEMVINRLKKEEGRE